MEFHDLKKQYELEFSNYNSLCKEVIRQLEVLFKEKSIKLAVPIHFRIKEWESIIDKCQRYSLQPSKIGEINDLAGIRIVTLFKSDISTIQQIIKSTFTILREEDTANRLSEDQFGYGSIHYEITLPDSWVEIPALRTLKGKNVEIQLRTASQHAWAAASHILNYKKESHVPQPVRRTINRVSALLETVDLEFERVLQEREEFDQIPIEDQDTLNTDTLRKILDRMLPAENKGIDEDYSIMLDELNHFGITNVGGLESLINNHLSKALEKDKRIVNDAQNQIKKNKSNGVIYKTDPERLSKGVFYLHKGLLREILRQEFEEEIVDNVILKSTR
ncbi:hypothetical protein MOD78_02445 [Bacillus haynesii]|uniref:GTP pyrophosphokinase n=1 Tax=Bacillus haynesii TaxID=1925021 RepID=UPI00227F6631|nr:hypothetical protein [Bacillus haynesii]MCY8410627.1 hypothetical protein [Bacillus haynesii]MCY8432564.1 hypothetical protein [Bacillus haynesii]MCY8624469.1 hypothetical protein [Bacillus haynesii]MCY8737761.1 hypothetical protein [Bacillus haynesii]